MEKYVTRNVFLFIIVFGLLGVIDDRPSASPILMPYVQPGLGMTSSCFRFPLSLPSIQGSKINEQMYTHRDGSCSADNKLIV